RWGPTGLRPVGSLAAGRCGTEEPPALRRSDLAARAQTVRASASPAGPRRAAPGSSSIVELAPPGRVAPGGPEFGAGRRPVRAQRRADDGSARRAGAQAPGSGAAEKQLPAQPL